MNVTIMYRNNFDGGDGWAYYPMGIEIGNCCPICGGERGKPYSYRFHEDGDWFVVSKWDNPCGHVDTYGECLKESRRLKVQLEDTIVESFIEKFGEESLRKKIQFWKDRQSNPRQYRPSKEDLLVELQELLMA